MLEHSLPPSFPQIELSRVHAALLTWFDRHQRPLPWRLDRDPYKIWISEVMLQQTTVRAVIPYFERFLQRFPTLESLARAELDEVLKLWEGLGYYRRARHLHAAARRLWNTYGEVWPTDKETWSELPGIGRYMVGAVLSQAFDRPLPIVEANSLRVLCRLFGFDGDPRASLGQKWLWTAAESLVPQKRPGDFNQALMELGSQVCKIQQPNCSECPLRPWCRAASGNLQDSIPQQPRRKVLEPVTEIALAVFHGSRLLLGRRSASASRWANLWEIPHAEVASVRRRDVTKLARTFGINCSKLKPFGTHTHNVTRYQITLNVWIGEAHELPARQADCYVEWHWVPLDKLSRYATSSPQRQLWNRLVKERQQPKLF